MKRSESAGLFQAYYRKRAASWEGLPGPDPVFPFGNALDFRHNWPWQVCARYAQEYGPITLIWLGTKPALVLNDPKAIYQVLVNRWLEFYKDAPVKALQPVITPKSLFITNPPQWRPARQNHPLTMPNFGQWLERILVPVRDCLLKRLAKVSTHPNPANLYWEMQRLAFHAFAVAFWGRELAEKQFKWFQTLARTGSRRINWPLPLLPAVDPLFLWARRSWYRFFEAEVAHARQHPNPQAFDLLNVTLTRGTELSNAELAEALATNFFGGVFSCSSTINSSLYLLQQHPAEKEKLLEALAVLSLDHWPTIEQCPQLDAFVRESMRVLPAVPLYFRNSDENEDVILEGHTLPPDTLLLISNWWLHRHSPHWGDPETFRPDRWDRETIEVNPIGSDYFFPFGRGPRMCIGMPFALFYIKLTLAVLLQHFDCALEPHSEYKQSFFFGVMMPRGLHARFRSKHSANSSL